jgi:hypothetical protein
VAKFILLAKRPTGEVAAWAYFVTISGPKSWQKMQRKRQHPNHPAGYFPFGKAFKD